MSSLQVGAGFLKVAGTWEGCSLGISAVRLAFMRFLRVRPRRSPRCPPVLGAGAASSRASSVSAAVAKPGGEQPTSTGLAFLGLNRRCRSSQLCAAGITGSAQKARPAARGLAALGWHCSKASSAGAHLGRFLCLFSGVASPVWSLTWAVGPEAGCFLPVSELEPGLHRLVVLLSNFLHKAHWCPTLSNPVLAGSTCDEYQGKTVY